MMKKIIPAIPVEKLLEELTEERFFRMTNNGNNEIYIINSKNSPNTMMEIGRLREISFRDSGGGTGLATDIDKYDVEEPFFEQLIVWNPEDQVIMGGYRFLNCKNLPIQINGQVDTPTSELFHYSDTFIKEYLPFTIELGRSFVQPDYQPSNNMRKGMFAMDNLWDGLGALMVENPDIRYLFGKVTMYRHFNQPARDLILYFIKKHFPDKDNLVHPYEPIEIQTDISSLEKLFVGTCFEEDYRILNQNVRFLSENIPPLVNSYINLSPSMRSFGTSLNPSFGNVEETAIMVTIGDIYENKKDRHLHYEKNEKPKHLR